jgi:hypothetical protein
VLQKKGLSQTLFERLRGKPLRQAKSAEALALYGHQVKSEIEAGPPTKLRELALQLFELR